MRPQIIRLGADICCFQEVHGQERPGQPRALLALRRLLEGTNLDGANLATTKPHDNDVYDERNIVVATHHAVVQREQLMNNLVDEPLYKRLTALPPDATAQPIGIERPVLHVKVDVGPFVLHVINVHLKSKIPTDIPGQKIDNFTWRTADAFAEGSFISSMKRMSQALEVRRLVDNIFTADADARIIVAGDFNATPDEIPVLAIRGNVEDTGNGDLAGRVLVPIENTIPESSRYTLFH
ncbi:MAG: endonuclease/exonuclease/phosphatase family protein [Actinomycetota bacterium]|nr:endonuclease/exonuclease/phosphatase family protein [Actinomycetota bacterium]